jgi:hypothetical protein
LVVASFAAEGTVAYGDLDAIIGEDERRIGRCQLSGRHLECVDADSALAWAGSELWCSDVVELVVENSG